MKSNFSAYLKASALSYILAIALIACVFIDPFSVGLNTYLEGQITSLTVSLGLVMELKALASASSSSHIPLISGVSANTMDTLTEAIQYLSWSDLLVTSQLILLTLSKTLLVKVLLITAFLGSLIPKYRSASLKILVVILLINPGLPVYVTCIQYTAKEAKLNQAGHNLSEDLKAIHAKYLQKEAAYQAKKEGRNQRQLATAETKGKNRIGLLNRIKDKAEDDVAAVATKVEEEVSDAYLILKTGAEELIVKIINLFTGVLIQFILLPFLFFYGLFTLFKKFVSGSISDSFLESLIVYESVIISITSLLTIL